MRRARDGHNAAMVDAAGQLTAKLGQQQSRYAHGEERPLGGYAVLLGVYGTAVGAAGLWVRRNRSLPERPSAADVAMVALAAHKLSRLVTKDAVTSVVRAPVTRYREPGSPGEVVEDVRGHGLRHAVGELVTCPFCLDVWGATAFMFGLVIAPRATRMVAAGLAAVTGSDFLQLAYCALDHAA